MMEESKDKNQTAVQWLIEQIVNRQNGEFDDRRLDTIFDQALEMEKEQHQSSFDKGYDRRNYIHDFEYGGIEYWEEEPKEFIDYYIEIYGK
jgi:hypothetical protein